MKETIRILLLASLVTLKSAFVWFTNGRFIGGVDDAQIYKTYMKNLAVYGEWIYNAGGEKVEGTTSVLWTLLGVPLYYIDGLWISLLIVNILVVTTILYKVSSEIKKYCQQKRFFNPYNILLLGLVMVIPGYIEWTVNSLLETGLWSFSVVFLFFLSIKPHTKKNDVSFIVFLALLLLTRPESILIGGFFILSRWFFNFNTGYNYIMPIMAYMLILTGITGYRLIYFGYPFPNTYYAKVSASFGQNFLYGLQYVFKSFTVNILFATSVILAIETFISARRLLPKNKIRLIAASFILLVFAIPLIVGGDHFNYSRMLQPYFPIIFFFHLIWFYRKVNFKWKHSLIFIFLFVFIPSSGLLHQLKGKSLISHEFGIAKNGIKTANRLNQFLKRLDTYPEAGVVTTGGFGYKYLGKTNDLLGLNNLEMAHYSNIKNGVKNHGSFEPDVFFKQRPDLLITHLNYVDHVHSGLEHSRLRSSQMLGGLELSKDFNDKYHYGVLVRGQSGIKGFFSKRFTESLKKNNTYSFKQLDYTIRKRKE